MSGDLAALAAHLHRTFGPDRLAEYDDLSPQGRALWRTHAVAAAAAFMGEPGDVSPLDALALEDAATGCLCDALVRCPVHDADEPKRPPAWSVQVRHAPAFRDGRSEDTAEHRDRYCLRCGDALRWDLPFDDACSAFCCPQHRAADLDHRPVTHSPDPDDCDRCGLAVTGSGRTHGYDRPSDCDEDQARCEVTANGRRCTRPWLHWPESLHEYDAAPAPQAEGADVRGDAAPGRALALTTDTSQPAPAARPAAFPSVPVPADLPGLTSDLLALRSTLTSVTRQLDSLLARVRP